MSAAIRVEAPPVYVTLGFPFPVAMSVGRKSSGISPSYPARMTFAFKVRDPVLADELLEIQRIYLDSLKHFFPSNPSLLKMLDKLAIKVYNTVPPTAIARPLYPIASGAKAPFIMVHYSDARVYKDTACNWRRVECVRDALVFMILGGNETSIVSLHLNPLDHSFIDEVWTARVTPLDLEVAPTVVAMGLNNKTEAFGSPHPVDPCKGHPSGACRGALQNSPQNEDSRSMASVAGSPLGSLTVAIHGRPSSASATSARGGSSQVVESESLDVEHPDWASVVDSVPASGSNSSSGDFPDDYDVHRIALGSFDSTKDFLHADVKGVNKDIRILVVPKKILIDIANLLMFEGFQYLMEASPKASTIYIYFGAVHAMVKEAYLAQSRRRDIALSGTDHAVSQLLATCELWDVISYSLDILSITVGSQDDEDEPKLVGPSPAGWLVLGIIRVDFRAHPTPNHRLGRLGRSRCTVLRRNDLAQFLVESKTTAQGTVTSVWAECLPLNVFVSIGEALAGFVHMEGALRLENMLEMI
ncbi:hypothetical protein B0H15DRAFT_806813 [Mycena belliarum]|uniref:Uncharacterized protein n=1 Tax=Mycena belliarum TaxID=1033014 RepID=A0AAD6XGW7_9AGAR|nr:hypothetical protein B0H15DRAFT_806813 [Mycena belliae]